MTHAGDTTNSDMSDYGSDALSICDGMETVRSFGDAISSDNAMWLSPRCEAMPHEMLVSGSPHIDVDGAWTFGVEWHGNVARHVRYLLLPEDSPQVMVLFHDSFDKNAVDIALGDGLWHVVLVQGMTPRSFSSVWEVVRHKVRCETVPRRSVAIPAMSLLARVPGELEPKQLLRIDTNGKGGWYGEECESDLSFSDTFCLFAYEDPRPDHDVRGDFRDIGEPVLAMLVTDIKLLQRQAERLDEYDPSWGRDDAL